MSESRIDRRTWTKGVIAGSLTASIGFAERPSASNVASRSVFEENKLPGSREWINDNTQIDPATEFRSPAVEGYCSHASILVGETLQFFLSANPASTCTLDIYRLGYYGGMGGRLMQRLGPIDCTTQQDPEVGPRRLRDCHWRPSADLVVPPHWRSGVYVGKITESREGIQSYVIFIVRDDRPADLIFQCSDHTWQAYNRWPSEFSLYNDGTVSGYWGPNVEVSFNRPYGKYCQVLDQPLSIGSGEFFLWEFPFAYWLESEGFDVTYISNQDTHRDAAGLQRAKGFLSVGHDEYWTIEMFRNVQKAIAQGISVGFFSGNSVLGKIQFDWSERNFRRVGVFGPPKGHREHAGTSELPHERPYGNELMGAHTTGYVTGGSDWICSAPDHWIYEGTGMREGDSVPGIIGWEWHGDPAPIEGLEIVARGPTRLAPDREPVGEYTATVYPGPRGNFVFNASTCWWCDGLSEPPGYVRPGYYAAYPKGPDARIQRITKNVLLRMGATALSG